VTDIGFSSLISHASKQGSGGGAVKAEKDAPFSLTLFLFYQTLDRMSHETNRTRGEGIIFPPQLKVAQCDLLIKNAQPQTYYARSLQ